MPIFLSTFDAKEKMLIAMFVPVMLGLAAFLFALAYNIIVSAQLTLSNCRGAL